MPEFWRYWLSTCLESHALCRALRPKQNFFPDKLIEIIVDKEDKDTLSWRLRSHDDINLVGISYLTLSHCWGLSENLSLKKENYDSCLTAPGDSTLPKTYRDAFRVAVWLEFRFLWIDSLCIIQDSLDDWRTQSLMMGAIYNIAATWASDGDDGCFSKRYPFTITPTTITLNAEEEESKQFQISDRVTYDEEVINAPPPF